MHSFILSLFWLLCCFSLAYMFVLLIITIGWFRIKKFSGFQAGTLPDVSVILAVRNEENNIINTLSDLIRQDYPKNQFEIVVVNDHSDDDTEKLVQTFIRKNREFRIQLIKASGIGKKAAIREGIKKASFNCVVTTDGDCSFGVNWLRRMAEYQLYKDAKLIVGPVVYNERKGLLQKLFSLDFMSLVASGAGSLGMDLPLMANGANMLFSKQTYNAVTDTQMGAAYTSGDDVFLLQAIARKYGTESVHFIKDQVSIVSTEPPDSFSTFLMQRKRWASKAKAYTNWWPVLVSLIVFGTNLMLVLSFLFSVLKLWFLIIFGLFGLLKILTDFPLLHGFAEFSDRKKHIPYIFLFGFLYPFYIVFTAISSFFFSFNWKERKHTK